MPKALILRGFNFSSVALGTITILTDPVPCTGITLSQSSASMSAVNETLTLTATVTPSDTTDNVAWSSSDESVATVSNGIVTAHGIGTTVISATCGNHTATCEITVAIKLSGVNLSSGAYLSISNSPTYEGGNGLVLIKRQTSAKYGVIAATSGNLTLRNTYEGVQYYPVQIPTNTKKLKFTISDSNVANGTIYWFSSTVSAPNNPTIAQCVAKNLGEDVIAGDGILSIPSYDGYPQIDAAAFQFLTKNSAEFTDSLFESITIDCLDS